MKKEEFLKELRSRLRGLPKQDLEDRLSFYREAIDDRVAEGKSEEEAVADLGSIDSIVSEIAKEVPLAKLVKEKVTPKRSLRGWEILLLVLGFPLWFPLVIVGLVLCLVFYMLTWVLVIVTYAVEIALIGGSIASIVAFFVYLGQGVTNLTALGGFIGGIGGAMLFFFVCVGATKVTLMISKAILTSLKSRIMKKGNN